MANSSINGRFRVLRVIQDKPYILAMVEPYEDVPPEGPAAVAMVAAQEARVWECMQDVLRLASKLYGHTGLIGKLAKGLRGGWRVWAVGLRGLMWGYG